MKVGLRRNTAVRFFAALLAAAGFAFSSCGNLGLDEKSFQNKVSSYFEEMTSNAAVGAYQLDPANAPTDKYGNFCFPYDQECKVTLLLRNPQRYRFDSHNMEFEMKGNPGPAIGAPWSDANSVLIEQDASDTSKIYITYPSDFLKAHPLGDDISPVVRLYHPVSHAAFNIFQTLKLSSNAPPPAPSGALVVQTNESTGSTGSKWVVCFKLPGSSAINNYHSDITSVSINGTSFATSIASGVISYPDGAALSKNAPSVGLAKNQVTGLDFTPESGTIQAQDAYFMTGDAVDQNQRVYTITVTDSAGLSSSVAVSARGFKLSAPDAYQITDTSYQNKFNTGVSTASKNTVGQDPNDGSAWVAIRAEAKTAGGLTDGDGHAIDRYDYDPSNAYLVYELHREAALNTSTLIRTGTLSGVSGKISIPAGTTYVKAFVRKPLYADSDPVVWNCRAVCTNLFVKESGVDDGGEGSKAKPYRTIQRAIKQFQDGIDVNDYGANTILNIRLLSDLTPPESFPWSSNENSFAKVAFSGTVPAGLVVNIIGEGGRRTIDMSGNADKYAIRVLSGEVNIDNIDIAGLESNSGPALILKVSGSASVVYTNGSAYSNGGQDGSYISVDSTAPLGLKMQNVTLKANHADLDGIPGAILVMDGATVECSDCEFINNSGYTYGAIYNDAGGTLTMTRCSLTGSRAPDGNGGAINNFGTCSLSNVTITGTDTESSGAIFNSGALTLEKCTITGNKSNGDCAGVYNAGSSFTFTLKAGTTKILDNLIPVAMGSAPTKQGNVYLPVGKKITIDTGANLGDSRIGVNVPYTSATPAEDKPSAAEPRKFTTGYDFDATNAKKPGLVFVAENGYGVTDKDGEAAFAVSGGGMYDPTDFKITTALDGAMAKPNVDKTFNVTINAFRKENGAFPASANLEYHSSDHKLYVKGDTPGNGTVPAAGEGSDNPAVTWSAALYNGGQKISGGIKTLSADGLSVTLKGSAMPQPDTYILKITATYMGYTHDASFPITVRNVYGDKSAPTAVGDIVFSDGTATPYSDSLVLDANQKANAVAVIFYANGGDPYLGNRIIGVGLKEGSNLMWAPSGTPGYDLGFYDVEPRDESDGSKNWGGVCAVDSTAAANMAAHYPAFNYANTYGVEISGEASGWYLPAHRELAALLGAKDTVNNAIGKIGSPAVSVGNGPYWSSLPYKSTESYYYTYATAIPFAFVLKAEGHNVRAIRKF